MSLSIGSICPEIDFAASEARKTASAAMSLGFTNLDGLNRHGLLLDLLNRLTARLRATLEDVLNAGAVHGAWENGVSADALPVSRAA
jgi:hypothetical protein